MKNYLKLFLLLLTHNVFAMGQDDPLIFRATIDQWELRETKDDHSQLWDINLWVGKDLQKLWLKMAGERVASKTQRSELRILYGEALTPNWDVMMGVKKDAGPGPKRTWLEVGVQGIAPYFFDTDISLFMGESGRVELRVEGGYEWMLTQKWVLAPELEINLSAQNDKETHVGSGLSRAEASLHLRYEIRRELSPYIGIQWEKAYGNTAQFHRAQGEDSSDIQWVVGLHAWF